MPKLARRVGDERCELFGDAAATYGGAPVRAMFAMLIDGRLAGWQVEIPAREYEAVRGALAERWGAGAEAIGEAISAGGATLASRRWTTTVDGASITLVERSARVDTALVDVASAALQARRAESPAKRAGDL